MKFFVKVTPISSELLQKIAFRNGWRWCDGTSTIACTGYPHLGFKEDKMFGRDGNGPYFLENKYIEVPLEQAIDLLNKKPDFSPFCLKVTPQTSTIIQNLAFKRNIGWLRTDKTLHYYGIWLGVDRKQITWGHSVDDFVNSHKSVSFEEAVRSLV